MTDMTIDVALEQMEYKGLRGDSLQVKLEELGFKSLVKRIFGEENQKTKKPNNQIGLF